MLGSCSGGFKPEQGLKSQPCSRPDVCLSGLHTPLSAHTDAGCLSPYLGVPPTGPCPPRPQPGLERPSSSRPHLLPSAAAVGVRGW